MANEINIRSSLSIQKGKLNYTARPTAFSTDMDTATPDGPTPGAITVPIEGIDVNLSTLTTPGLCRIMNIDASTTNYVEIGIVDIETGKFYPLMELLSGETYVFRLARNLGEEFGTSTGTGTTGVGVNLLRARSFNANANLIVEAFEK